MLAVPAVGPLIDRWRLATVESAAQGGPPHVTALYPWIDAPVGEQSLADVADALASCEPVALTFDRLDRFPSGVLYLALDHESEQAVRRLTAHLMRHYPECLPYGGEFPDPHPHLTVAQGAPRDLDAIATEVADALEPHLPFRATVDHLVVMERNAESRWIQAHCVALGGGAPPA